LPMLRIFIFDPLLIFCCKFQFFVHFTILDCDYYTPNAIYFQVGKFDIFQR